MIIKVTLACVETVDVPLESIYNKSIIIQQGSDLFLDESSPELRKRFIEQYGDGKELYILCPSRFTQTGIHVNPMGIKQTSPTKLKSVNSASDIKRFSINRGK